MEYRRCVASEVDGITRMSCLRINVPASEHLKSQWQWTKGNEETDWWGG